MMMHISPQQIQSLMSGEFLRSGWLRKQYLLIGEVVLLIFIYILGGYNSMQQHNRLTDLKNEVRDAKFEYLTISAKKVESTRQSQIASLLQEKGSSLRESQKPATLIHP